MKRRILVIVMAVALVLSVSTKSDALFGLGGLLKGIVQAEMSLLKMQIDGITANITAKLDSVINIQNEMKADIKASVATVAGFNNKIEQINKSVSQSAGGDINSNDSDLMWKIIYGCLSIIGTQFIAIIGLLRFMISLTFGKKKEEKKKAYYMASLAKHLTPESFDKIMAEKDGIIDKPKKKI